MPQTAFKYQLEMEMRTDGVKKGLKQSQDLVKKNADTMTKMQTEQAHKIDTLKKDILENEKKYNEESFKHAKTLFDKRMAQVKGDFRLEYNAKKTFIERMEALEKKKEQGGKDKGQGGALGKLQNILGNALGGVGGVAGKLGPVGAIATAAAGALTMAGAAAVSAAKDFDKYNASLSGVRQATGMGAEDTAKFGQSLLELDRPASILPENLGKIASAVARVSSGPESIKEATNQVLDLAKAFPEADPEELATTYADLTEKLGSSSDAFDLLAGKSKELGFEKAKEGLADLPKMIEESGLSVDEFLEKTKGAGKSIEDLRSPFAKASDELANSWSSLWNKIGASAQGPLGDVTGLLADAMQGVMQFFEPATQQFDRAIAKAQEYQEIAQSLNDLMANPSPNTDTQLANIMDKLPVIREQSTYAADEIERISNNTSMTTQEKLAEINKLLEGTVVLTESLRDANAFEAMAASGKEIEETIRNQRTWWEYFTGPVLGAVETVAGAAMTIGTGFLGAAKGASVMADGVDRMNSSIGVVYDRIATNLAATKTRFAELQAKLKGLTVGSDEYLATFKELNGVSVELNAAQKEYDTVSKSINTSIQDTIDAQKIALEGDLDRLKVEDLYNLALSQQPDILQKSVAFQEELRKKVEETYNAQAKMNAAEQINIALQKGAANAIAAQKKNQIVIKREQVKIEQGPGPVDIGKAAREEMTKRSQQIQTAMDNYRNAVADAYEQWRKTQHEITQRELDDASQKRIAEMERAAADEQLRNQRRDAEKDLTRSLEDFVSGLDKQVRDIERAEVDKAMGVLSDMLDPVSQLTAGFKDLVDSQENQKRQIADEIAERQKKLDRELADQRKLQSTYNEAAQKALAAAQEFQNLEFQAKTVERMAPIAGPARPIIGAMVRGESGMTAGALESAMASVEYGNKILEIKIKALEADKEAAFIAKDRATYDGKVVEIDKLLLEQAKNAAFLQEKAMELARIREAESIQAYNVERAQGEKERTEQSEFNDRVEKHQDHLREIQRAQAEAQKAEQLNTQLAQQQEEQLVAKKSQTRQQMEEINALQNQLTELGDSQAMKDSRNLTLLKNFYSQQERIRDLQFQLAYEVEPAKRKQLENSLALQKEIYANLLGYYGVTEDTVDTWTESVVIQVQDAKLKESAVQASKRILDNVNTLNDGYRDEADLTSMVLKNQNLFAEAQERIGADLDDNLQAYEDQELALNRQLIGIYAQIGLQKESLALLKDNPDEYEKVNQKIGELITQYGDIQDQQKGVLKNIEKTSDEIEKMKIKELQGHFKALKDSLNTLGDLDFEKSFGQIESGLDKMANAATDAERINAAIETAAGFANVLISIPDTINDIQSTFKTQGPGKGISKVSTDLQAIGSALMASGIPPLMTAGAAILAVGIIGNIIGKIVEAIVGREKTAEDVAKDRARVQERISQIYKAQIGLLETQIALGNKQLSSAREQLKAQLAAHKALLEQSKRRKELAALSSDELAKQKERLEVERALNKESIDSAETLSELGRDERKKWLEAHGYEVKWYTNTKDLMKEAIADLKARGTEIDTELGMLDDEIGYQKALLGLLQQQNDEHQTSIDLLTRIALRANDYEDALGLANETLEDTKQLLLDALEAEGLLAKGLNQVTVSAQAMSNAISGIGATMAAVATSGQKLADAMGGMGEVKQKVKLADFSKMTNQQIADYLYGLGTDVLDSLDAQTKTFINNFLDQWESLGDQVFTDEENLINLRRQAGEITDEVGRQQLLDLYNKELERLISIQASEEEQLELKIKIKQIQEEINGATDEEAEKQARLAKLVRERQKALEALRAGEGEGAAVVDVNKRIRAELANQGMSDEEIERFMRTLPQRAEGGPVDEGLIYAHDDEWVMKADAVKKYGQGFMKRLNSLQVPIPDSPIMRQLTQTAMTNNQSQNIIINVTVDNDWEINGNDRMAQQIANQQKEMLYDAINQGIKSRKINVNIGGRL